MIKVKYNIGSKPHIQEFKTESEFVEWIKENYKYKIFEISGAAEKGIVLKNIDLSGITFDEEIKKFKEEIKEFMDVIENKDTDNSFNHASEETFDILQVCLGLIEKKYGKGADEVMRMYKYHEIKSENRHSAKEGEYD